MSSQSQAQASPVRRIRDLPGPPGLPVLGNALQVRPKACTGGRAMGARTASCSGFASPLASSS